MQFFPLGIISRCRNVSGDCRPEAVSKLGGPSETSPTMRCAGFFEECEGKPPHSKASAGKLTFQDAREFFRRRGTGRLEKRRQAFALHRAAAKRARIESFAGGRGGRRHGSRGGSGGRGERSRAADGQVRPAKQAAGRVHFQRAGGDERAARIGIRAATAQAQPKCPNVKTRNRRGRLR